MTRPPKYGEKTTKVAARVPISLANRLKGINLSAEITRLLMREYGDLPGLIKLEANAHTKYEQVITAREKAEKKANTIKAAKDEIARIRREMEAHIQAEEIAKTRVLNEVAELRASGVAICEKCQLPKADACQEGKCKYEDYLQAIAKEKQKVLQELAMQKVIKENTVHSSEAGDTLGLQYSHPK